MTAPLRGLSFPFRVELPRRDAGGVRTGGGVRAATGADKLRQDLFHVLSTRRGERPMLRAYGGGVHQRLQEPNDGSLRALARRELEDALRAFLPEVRLVGPLRIASRGAELWLELDFRADPDALVQRLALPLP